MQSLMLEWAQMVGISALLIMRRGEMLMGTAPAGLEAVRWGSHAALAVLWAGAFLAVWSLSNCAPTLTFRGTAWGGSGRLLAHHSSAGHSSLAFGMRLSLLPRCVTAQQRPVLLSSLREDGACAAARSRGSVCISSCLATAAQVGGGVA